MALQITLVKTPAKVSVSKTSQTFSKQGGTLGRGETNAWTLPDPDKFLSSCHCEVLFDAGAYYLLDLSTNGTFVNNSLDPLGKGSKSPLNNGDFFEIGEYRFSVSVVPDQRFPGDSPYAMPAGAASFAVTNDIFGSNPVNAAHTFADPFSSPGFSLPDSSLEFGNSVVDPLVFLDGARNTAYENKSSSLFDPVTGTFNAPANVSYCSPAADHSPNIDQAILWPGAAHENLIPEDWSDDLLSPPPVASKMFDQALPSALPIQEHAKPNPGAKKVSNPSVQVLAPAAARAPSPNQSHSAAPISSQLTQANSANRLIAAMGLDVDRLSSDQMDDISDMVGALMRETVNGLMQVLRSRASIKNEFRMNVTTIQPVENNPLKFSVGVDEALENMFIKKTNGYKKPIDAFREGFQEIGEHQVAVIAGIRHGFEKMMDRFDPESLEQSFNKHGKSGVIPGMQKAKYWNSYKEYYADFEDNMESSFQHLFGGDFVNAYEDQLRKLTASRKKT